MKAAPPSEAAVAADGDALAPPDAVFERHLAARRAR